MPYPVAVSIVPQTAGRNKLTTAFRLILALPHLILVGGVATSLWSIASKDVLSLGGNTGILGAIAWLLAIVSWFTIVLSGQHVAGIREFTKFVLRWRARSIAYSMLLVDDYPPFGDARYPVSLEIADPPGRRNRLTVGLRLLLVIPLAIVLYFVVLGWWITSVIAWFAILVTGDYPRGLYSFGAGVFRWNLRVEAYLLLLVDEYPPFSGD
jgi:Domain of unknown function (DUF4389)